MPALYDLFRKGLLPHSFSIIGYARSPRSDAEFRASLRDDVERYCHSPQDDRAWFEFASRVHYLPGEFSSEQSMDHLAERLKKADREEGTEGRRLFYCATPPSAFPDIAERLREEGLSQGSRIIVEKPFGRDARSARELNATLHRCFDESQIFRIDHYLGKETVQNILAFRFSNGMFEPIWNRRYVAQVQIDVSETLGVEGRGRFYEEAGAIRDIVQNHMLQLLAVLTLEPPAAFDAESIRDEKVKLLRSVSPVSKVVRGQYTTGLIEGEKVPGYRQEDGVLPESKVETFVALDLRIENWRWAGIPFVLRTGKRLPRRATQVTVVFQDAPHMLFQEWGADPPEPNHITIRIQPDEGISLTFDAKVPGTEMRVTPVKMDFSYEGSFTTGTAEAYERLLHDAMEGDRTLFLRADEIERSWEIIESLLDGDAPAMYPAGTWGPPQSSELLGNSRWYLE